MAPIRQIALIENRSGTLAQLPGAPTALSPTITFSKALDVSEFAWAPDAQRLFIGASPSVGQPNYERVLTPYQNVEILTEFSYDVVNGFFNRFFHDTSSAAYLEAYLAPNTDYQDILVYNVQPQSVYRLNGLEVMGQVKFFVYDVGNNPLQTGDLRFAGIEGDEEAQIEIDQLIARRPDLAGEDAEDGDIAYEGVSFRFVPNGTDTDAHWTFQYLNPYEFPLRLYWRVEHPRPDIVSGLFDNTGGINDANHPPIPITINHNQYSNTTTNTTVINNGTTVSNTVATGGTTQTIYVTTGVTSVNTREGDVILNKTDVGLGNVTNIDNTNASTLITGTVNVDRLPNTVAFLSDIPYPYYDVAADFDTQLGPSVKAIATKFPMAVRMEGTFGASVSYVKPAQVTASCSFPIQILAADYSTVLATLGTLNWNPSQAYGTFIRDASTGTADFEIAAGQILWVGTDTAAPSFTDFGFVLQFRIDTPGSRIT